MMGMMGPFDPYDVELFAALDYVRAMQHRYGAQGWEAITQENLWAAW